MKLRSIARQNGAALVEYLLLSSLMTVALIAGVSELGSNMTFALMQFPSAPQMVAVMSEGNPLPQTLGGRGQDGGGTEEVMPNQGPGPGPGVDPHQGSGSGVGQPPK